MTDHDALLRAICDNPADDVAMSQRDEFDPLRLRWELIEKPRREKGRWVEAAVSPSLLAPTAGGPLFRRGFPWCISFTPSQFLAHAAQLLREVPAPTLSHTSHDDAINALAQSPKFARVAGLHLRNTRLRPRTVELLANSPHAAALENLSSGFNGIEVGALQTLLPSGLFSRLTRLELTGPPSLGSYLVSNLRHAKPGRLRELSLTSAGLTGRHVERVLASPTMRGLTRLSLASNQLGLTGYEGTVRAELPHLRDLNLSATAPGPEGIRLLSTSALLSRLSRLVFSFNHVNRALTAELAECRAMSNLRVLDLGSNSIGNDGASAIARSPHFAGLLVLNLSYSQVGDEGIEAILESPLADKLVLLDLRGSPASEEAKEVLNAKMGDRVRL
jgi:hypothetical protein